MTIENENIIDMAGIDKKTGSLILLISDHLDWSNKIRHLIMLQNKINKYLSYIESGEVYEQFPQSISVKKIIEISAKYPIPKEVEGVYESAAKRLHDAGFGFKISTVEE